MIDFPQVDHVRIPQEDKIVFYWTLDRYHRAIEAGIFTEEDNLELLFGQIIPKTSIGVLHREYLKYVRKYFLRFVDQFDSGVQDPITLLNNTEPEPDFSLITQKRYTKKTGHPGPKDVHLIVEVSDDTLAFDRAYKANAYALSDIQEYWIVNVKSDQIELYLKPNVARGEYDHIVRYGRGESFESPLCGLVSVEELLPSPEEE